MTLKRAAWFVVALQLAALAWMVGVVVQAQNTVNLTNTRYNAESTGNVLTVPLTITIPGGNCEGGNNYNVWGHSAMATHPGASCVSGSNVTTAQVDFDDASNRILVGMPFRLPADWTGAIDLQLYWLTTATTGDVKWNIQTVCVANNESMDPAWNTAQTITDTALGSASRVNTAAQTSLTLTGCAAGELFFWRITRDGTAMGDTIAATASLVSVELTYRRAI